MKSWLIALLGVSLVAISYTAYELELKKPATQPLIGKVAATGKPVTAFPAQKTQSPDEKPVSPAPLSRAEPVETDPPAVQAEKKAPIEAGESAQAGQATETRRQEAGNAADASVEVSSQPEDVEPPSLAKKAMDTVASLLSGAIDADDRQEPAPGKAGPVGQTAPETQTAVQEPPLSPTSAVLAPVARAVDTVRKLLLGGDEEKPAAGKKAPQATVQDQARPSDAKPGEDAPKGLVERAVQAVTELVTPKKAVNGKNANPTNEDSETGTQVLAPAALAPAAPGGEITVAARTPDASVPVVEAAKPADGPIVPSFDVVRVERDGSAIVAGRAEPGADIELRAGGKTLGTAKASGRGEFVIIPDAPIPAGSSALALEATSGDGKVTKSNQVVTVAVPEPDIPSTNRVAVAPVLVPKAPVTTAPAEKAPEKIPAEIEIAAAPTALPSAATSAPEPKSREVNVPAETSPPKVPAEIEIVSASAAAAPEPKQKLAAVPVPAQAPEAETPAVIPQVSSKTPARQDNTLTVKPTSNAESVTTVVETPAPKAADIPVEAETKIASVPAGAVSAPPAVTPKVSAQAAAPLAAAPIAPVEAQAPLEKALAPVLEAPSPTVKAPSAVVKTPSLMVKAPSGMVEPADTRPVKPGKSDGVENARIAIIVPSNQTSASAPGAKDQAVVPKPQVKTPAAAEVPSAPAAPEVSSKVAVAPVPAEKSSAKTAKAPASKAAKVVRAKVAKAPAPKAAEAPAAKVADTPVPQVPAPAAPKIAVTPVPTPETGDQKVAAAPQTPSNQTAGVALADTGKAARPVAPDVTPSTAAVTPGAMETGAGNKSPMAEPEAPPALTAPKIETATTTTATVKSVAPEPVAATPPPPATKTPATKTPEVKIAQAPAPAKLTEPLVVVSEPGKPSQVLQGGNDKPKTPITFDTVDYDDEGQIILAGRVAPGADVRAYLGAAHLGDAKADPAGRWVLRTTRQIDPGTYQLRVDKIDLGGKVLARVTAPFERAAPEAVARVRANGEVIIQPGDNLWNISRALYGSGTQYTIIYDANRNQISKPELIFPGQVFMTPGAASAKTVDVTSG